MVEVSQTFQVRPLGLKIVLHHVENTGGAAGGRGDVEAVLGEAADDAVIADEAVPPSRRP